MERSSLPPVKGSNRKGKRAGRRSRGVTLKERDGYWHAHGRLWIDGRSVRIRASLGLAVKTCTQAEAEAALEAHVGDVKAQVSGKTGRGDPLSIAAHGYLSFDRDRPLKPTTINVVKECVARFGERRGNEIASSEWNEWIDGKLGANGKTMPGRMTGRSPATRERFVAGVLAFLNFAKRHHGLEKLPSFERDKKTRNPNRRKRRRVAELRPDLIQILFDCSHISIRAQLAVERCTGARVSSIIYAARICDLVIGKTKSHITFPGTKNGEDVTAALDASAVEILRDYLKWRGRLHDREAQLFLTYRRKAYVNNGGTSGGQNKAGFMGARRRACEFIMNRARDAAKQLRKVGDDQRAGEIMAAAQSDVELLGRVTQHWFRHRLASIWLRKDPRAAMEQGGWLDIRSIMGYAADAPEYRHQLVDELDDLNTRKRDAS